MAGRREHKAALRAQREARERELAAAQRRRRRLWQLGAVVAAAVVVVVAAIAISAGANSSPSTETTGAEASRNSAAVAKELAGISQSGDALGRASAPVTLQYYGDLECPVCRDITRGTLPAVIARQVDGDQGRSGRTQPRGRARPPTGHVPRLRAAVHKPAGWRTA